MCESDKNQLAGVIIKKYINSHDDVINLLPLFVFNLKLSMGRDNNN